MPRTAHLLLLLLVCLATRPITAWEVLHDTDFPGNTPHAPYGPGKSAEDCADQCQARDDCVAISWNGPDSPIHDNMCNFKCTTLGRHTDKGELVRRSSTTYTVCHTFFPSFQVGTVFVAWREEIVTFGLTLTWVRCHM